MYVVMSVLDEPRHRRCAAPAGESPAVMARFTAHRRLAVRLCQRYDRSPHYADLCQVADVALLMASRRYDPDAGPFERFAAVTISGELKKFLRRNGWSAHVPRRVQEDALTVQTVIDRLTVEHRRPPRLSEVAEAAHLPPERVRDAMHARAARFATDDRTVDHRCVDADDEAALDRVVVGDAIDTLAEQDRTLIELAFDHCLSQREIATRLGISQSQVQRRLARILDSLRITLAATV